ncbi:MAG: hypothetical protein HQL48_10580 [Gammaproteobacteria bacterium]|nr:hypothetical protein [Gammaproteobacteria bacterium]
MARLSDGSLVWWGRDFLHPQTTEVERVNCATGEIYTTFETSYGYQPPTAVLDSNGSAITGVVALADGEYVLLDDGSISYIYPSFSTATQGDGTTVTTGGFYTYPVNDIFGQPFSFGSSSTLHDTGSYGNMDYLVSDANDTLWLVGSNGYGQLGIGNNSYQSRPVQTIYSNNTPLEGVVDATAGTYHTAATLTDGSLWIWGDDRYGQLASGREIVRPYAAPVLFSTTPVTTTMATNTAPQFTSSPNLYGNTVDPYLYQITTSDAENHHRKFKLISVSPADAWGTPLAITSVNRADGTATLTGQTPPSGVCSVDVELGVIDGQGGSARQSFTIYLCSTGASS